MHLLWLLLILLFGLVFFFTLACGALVGVTGKAKVELGEWGGWLSQVMLHDSLLLRLLLRL
jgi:hypothetical protein